MDKKIATFGLIIVLLFLAGCTKERIEWEYMTTSIPDNVFTEEMGKLGVQGWDLVYARRAIDSQNNKGIYKLIFKRIKIEEKEKTEWQKREDAVKQQQELSKLGLYD